MAADVRKLLRKMQADWDARAREDHRYFIVDYRRDWSNEAFIASGEESVQQLILTDLENICQGNAPEQMRVLEIGCGAGRITRALALRFGEVHAVDVSGEMVKLARATTADLPNVRIFQNNGTDLSVLDKWMYDFAFSTCVFHHIPSKAVIETYIREVAKRLRPGCLFKFEVQGYLRMAPAENDTWFGVPMSDREMCMIADRCGFEARYRVGAGEERFWLWFFRTDEPIT